MDQLDQELIPYRHPSCGSSCFCYCSCWGQKNYNKKTTWNVFGWGDAFQKSLRLRRFKLDLGEIW